MSKMSNSWQEVALADIASDITVGFVGTMTNEYVDEGIPFLRSLNIEPYRINTNDLKYISPSFHHRLAKSKLLPGDLAVVRTGKPGTAAVIPFSLGECNCSDLVIIRPSDELDTRYLAYLFNSQWGQSAVIGRLVGSVQKHFNIGDAKRLRVRLPHIDEQRAIADILSAFDDKIDLNRRMNATLEATARALFQSWFVDFDPVHAKAAGRSPDGMDADTAALFPDSFEESALGLIPSGWRIRQLAEVAELVDCLHSKKPDAVAEGNLLLQVYNIGENGRIDLTKPYFITAEDYTLWTRRIEVTEGDLVITNTGRVGAVAQIPRGVKAALGRNMVGIRAKRNFALARFLKDYLVSNEMRREITLQTSLGTILESLHVRSVSKLRLCLPPKELIETYEMLVAPLHDQMDENDFQSRTLAETRDALLPKLISGQVRVGGKS